MPSYKRQSNCDKFSKLITNCTKEGDPQKFPIDPEMKILGWSCPEKSRDPGILQKSYPKNPGIEILENAGACSPQVWDRLNLLLPCMPNQGCSQFLLSPFLPNFASGQLGLQNPESKNGFPGRGDLLHLPLGVPKVRPECALSCIDHVVVICSHSDGCDNMTLWLSDNSKSCLPASGTLVAHQYVKSSWWIW